ncbi:MAG: tetratricopeptide repeat protein [Nitrospirota bacterium]
MSSTRHYLLAISLIIISSIIIYSNTLHVPFHYDDKPHIVNNRHIHIDNLSLSGLMDAGYKSIAYHRPVTNISFAINYYFGRLSTSGYHIVNILIHIITGITIYFFLFTTLRIRYQETKESEMSGLGSKNRCFVIALIAALLWTTSPVHTQAVTYIVQRATSMATMFYMLSLLYYVKGRVSGCRVQGAGVRNYCSTALLFCCSALFALLAFGTKEISITLPIVIILYEIYFIARCDSQVIKKRLLYLGLILGFFIIIAFLYINTGNGFIQGFKRLMSKRYVEQQGFTSTERLFTQFRVVIYYITLLILPLPSRLRLVYDFSISHSLIDPITTLISLFTILGLIVYAIFIVKKRTVISFFILWFFLNLAVESSILTILHLAFEHRLYLPSIGLFVIVAIGIVRLMDMVQSMYRYSTHNYLLLTTYYSLLIGIILIQSVWAIERNDVWGNEISLWRDSAEKSPDLALPHFNLGNAYRRKNDLESAIREYRHALRIKPDYYKANYNLGTAYRYTGNLDMAINEYKKFLKFRPNNYGAHNNLGKTYMKKGEFDLAVTEFNKVIRLKPDHLKAHLHLGEIYRYTGRDYMAIMEYREVLRIDPEFTITE